ncbi:MAG: D-alanyl-D-alanine carboxypeptidase family protein [Eubacterium sp.]|nr:D-alanyl-D-alanine carboxypeptidase family protein [Eubacterium sp.]
MAPDFPDNRQTDIIDLEALFDQEGQEQTETDAALSQLDFDGTDEEDEAALAEEKQRRKRNRLIGNIMIYSGIAIMIGLCIVTGVLLFMGQSGQPIQTLRFEEQSISVRAGHTVKLNVLTEPSGVQYAVSFTSSDSEIAEVEPDGTVTAIKAGEVTVTAKSGDLSAQCNITVQRDSISGFEISQHEIELNTGEEIKIELTCTPADAADKNFVWESSDTSVAKVKDGKITAAGSGEATVTVTDTVTEISRRISVTVTDPETAESIAFTEESITLEVGESYETVLTYTPDNIETKYSIFYTTDQSIASVDEYGVIVANSAGECVISAVYYYDDTVTAEINVTVIDPFVITGPESVEETPPPVEETPPPIGPSEPELPVISGTGIETLNGITYVNGIMIANKTYSLPADYDPGVQDDALYAFYNMQAAAWNDGINLYIISGYRSYYTQKGLYESYVASDGKANADRYSARPGYSEHQTGYAFDLNSVDDSFAYTAEAAWIRDNCYKFGFIVRYPEGKENITGYIYEPWHVRWLGDDLALSVYNSGLTLEEYFGITSEYSD